MKNTVFAVCMAGLLGCGNAVIDETGDSSSGAGGSSASSSAVTGSSSGSSSSSSASSGVTTSVSSSVGSGGASSSSSSSGTVGNGGEMAYQPLTFTMPSTPDAPEIVLGGVDEWQNFGSYTITNPNDVAFEIVSVTLKQTDPNGDIADFTSVRIDVENAAVEVGYGTFDPNTQEAVINLDGGIYANSSNIILAMAGKMANVQSSAACPQWHGCARSGHTPSLAVTSVTVQGASVPTTIINNPPKRVLRKSQPNVTQQALSSTTLANIDQDLIKFQIAADVAGAISIKTMNFALSKTGSFSVQNFRVRRGAVDLDPSTYTLTLACTAVTGCDNIFLPQDTAGDLVLIFNDEEVVTGAGNDYTVHATVSGSVLGDSLTCSMSTSSGDGNIVTGQIYSNYPLDVGITSAPPGTQDPFFIWSDMSEVPHSPTLSTAHTAPSSSADWTSGAFVQNLSFSQTLSL